MRSALDIIYAGEVHPARPWPRRMLTPEAWRAMAAALAEADLPEFQALWADTSSVYALFTTPAPLLLSAPVEAGLYAALSPHRPAAAWFERMVADLWGHQAAEAMDTRPWLDHGTWPVLRPMLPRPVPNHGGAERAEWAAEAGSHAMVLGPLPPAPVQPGEAVVATRNGRVEQLDLRLGFAHRGVLAAMRGKTPRAAARLAGRIAAEATVAHAISFSAAVEAAAGLQPPPRALSLRAVAAELERIAVHLADAETCLRAAGVTGTGLDERRERVLRACQEAFGHRLLMDFVVPGGTAADLGARGAAAVLSAVDGLDRVVPPRLGWLAGMGVVPPGVLARLAPGGPAGRAAGRPGDARLRPGGLPHPGFAPALRWEGDVPARIGLRFDEVQQSAALLRVLLATLPPGPIDAAVPPESGEGLGVAEGPHGPVWHWVQMERGAVASAFARDPAWVLGPALQAASVGADWSGVPVIAASFGLCAAGADL